MALKDICEYPTQEQLDKSNEPIAVDSETLGATRETNIPVYFSWASRDLIAGGGPTITQAGYDGLKRICESGRPIVMHNCKFDVRMLDILGIEVKGELHDTTLLHVLIDEHHLEYHRLKALSRELLGRARDDEYEMHAMRKQYNYYTDMPQDRSHIYAVADAVDTIDLFHMFAEQVIDMGLWDLYRNEVRAALAYKNIEQAGMRIELKYLEDSFTIITHALEPLREQIYRYFGERFKITSPGQLGDVLVKHFPLTEKTEKTGQWKTGRKILEEFRYDEKMQAVLAFRALSKARSTLKGYKERERGGRVYPQYRQTTTTGRSAASDPPVQQIPKQRGRITEVEAGSKALAETCSNAFRSVRKVFIPAKGASLLALDYSQVEYRVFAHYSGSERLLKELREGEDFHRKVCEMVFGEYNARLRHITKMLNYGLLYGMGEATMVKQLAGENHPEGIIRRYEAGLPEMRETQRRIKNRGSTRGFVQDVFGRRYRYVQEIGSYILVAWLCQGTAANIKKYALSRCDEILKGRRTNIIADIHDELVFELFPEDEELVPKIITEMERFPQFSIPIPVSMARGPNLLDMKEIEL